MKQLQNPVLKLLDPIFRFRQSRDKRNKLVVLSEVLALSLTRVAYAVQSDSDVFGWAYVQAVVDR